MRVINTSTSAAADRAKAVSSTEAFAALDARDSADAVSRADTIIEARERTSVWLKCLDPEAYKASIEAELSAVPGLALVWLWNDAGGDSSKVFDYFRVTPEQLRAFSTGLNVIADTIDALTQAALEQDCDRREEIQRLGHEAPKFPGASEYDEAF